MSILHLAPNDSLTLPGQSTEVPGGNRHGININQPGMKLSTFLRPVMNEIANLANSQETKTAHRAYVEALVMNDVVTAVNLIWGNISAWVDSGKIQRPELENILKLVSSQKNDESRFKATLVKAIQDKIDSTPTYNLQGQQAT